MSVDYWKMNQLVNELVDAPFDYGKMDCFIFTSSLVKAWHGKDYSYHLVYENEQEAQHYINVNGGIENLITRTLGKPIPPVECCDGDVATFEVSKNQIAIGFVFNGHALFKAKHLPIRVPLESCRKGWSVK